MKEQDLVQNIITPIENDNPSNIHQVEEVKAIPEQKEIFNPFKIKQNLVKNDVLSKNEIENKEQDKNINQNKEENKVFNEKDEKLVPKSKTEYSKEIKCRVYEFIENALSF